jgi:hypothetical protein
MRTSEPLACKSLERLAPLMHASSALLCTVLVLCSVRGGLRGSSKAPGVEVDSRNFQQR